MYLGNRKIRSAGRNSGSIEITLPAMIQLLEGVTCRIAMRDGLRPEIVLQPDLSPAQDLIQELWQKLHLGLKEIGDIPEFSWSDFSLTFFPSPHWRENPQLAYADALLIQQKRGMVSQSYQNNIQGEDEALARLLASLAMTAGHYLKLSANYALAFGDAVAYQLTGVFSNIGADFERGMAHRIFYGDGDVQLLGSPFDEQTWRDARKPLRHVFEQLQTWQATPSNRTLAREQWYRALSVEMKIF